MPRMIFYLAVSLILAAMLNRAAAEQPSGGNFRITQSVVAGGGGKSSGGNYVATGTAGQPEAQGLSSGGAYRLAPGFWSALPNDLIFQDTFEEQR